MDTSKINVTLNEATGLYMAEETDAYGMYAGFGKTPEEALERLALSRSLCSDCPECRALRAEGDGINPYDLSN